MSANKIIKRIIMNGGGELEFFLTTFISTIFSVYAYCV